MAIKEVKAEFDFSKMSVEDMLALAAKLEAQAKEQSSKLFDETINFLNDKLKSMGRSKTEAVLALYELMDGDEKRATVSALAPTQRKTRVAKTGGTAKDTTAMPVRGATYKNPANGETWTKAANGKGRTVSWLQALIDKGGKFEDYQVK